ncbi:hypothetical protein Hanom_Chr17g01583881 [Helianthus anomalus]
MKYTFVKAVFVGTDFGSSSFAWSVGILSANTTYFIVSQFWWLIGKKFVIAFNVVSETFKVTSFPKNKDAIPCQGHFITVNQKIHMFIVGKSAELTVELLKLEDEAWHKVSSFRNPQIVSFQSRRHLSI